MYKRQEENGVDLSSIEDLYKELSSKGKTPLFYSYAGQLIGLIVVSDVLKQTSKHAIDCLKDMHMNIYMSVSYTHLATIVKPMITLGTFRNLARLQPVSYTHLDVYKRQIQNTSLDYIFLRNSLFVEAFTSDYLRAVEAKETTISKNMGDGRVWFISRKDCACLLYTSFFILE